MTAIKIIEENRKKIVDKLIKNMENGYIFSELMWNKNALLPKNAITGKKYKGINKLNLSFAAMENNYNDPRWLTFKKIKELGWKLSKESRGKGVLCEKWIWERKEKVIDEKTGKPELDIDGNEIIKVVELNKPIISYFYLFNASLIEGIEPYSNTIKDLEESKITNVADKFILSSECPIEEKLQEKAYYSPLDDKIVLPPRKYFKSDEAFLGTLLHEMSHSTGHEKRLNRNILNIFGSPKYALEELTAELSCVFLEAELGLNIDFTRQDHINYFSSWIEALKNDANQLYKVANNASKACDRLLENYKNYIEIDEEKVACE